MKKGIKNNKGKALWRSARRVRADVGKKRRVNWMKILCWSVVPVMITALLLLDALGIYIFNTERLLVLGIGLLVILLPFFREVTVKGLSVKCGADSADSESRNQR